MLKDYGASRGYTYFVHQYNRASMLYHCLHALTMYHGSLLANNKLMCMDYKWDRKSNSAKEEMGEGTFHLEPLIFLVFPEVSHLRLRGHVRCLFITAILLMKYYRYFILFHVVTIWCFLSCERLLWVWTEEYWPLACAAWIAHAKTGEDNVLKKECFLKSGGC